jgi:MFS family permease
MDAFLEKFFHTVYIRKQHAHESHYCKYNNQGLSAFTSSLYLAGLVASVIASPITRKYGRRISIVCGGISFLVGATLNASAMNMAMLLLGRIMLGVGIGFGNQVSCFAYLFQVLDQKHRAHLLMFF